MNAVILGCGPAGLLAAAAVEAKFSKRPVIVSRKLPSRIGGAQFLHMPIPAYTKVRPDGVVQFVKRGSEAVYAMKIYGDPGAETSWNSYLAGPQPVWNMQELYVKLWARFEDVIIDQDLDAEALSEVVGMKNSKIISAIPAPVLCEGGHQFLSQSVDITIGTEHEEVFPTEAMTIVYNGRADATWYRASNIFGVSSTEWRQAPERYPHVKVSKPLGTNCNCRPEILRVGRYGEWRKGVLIHHAYESVLRNLHL